MGTRGERLLDLRKRFGLTQLFVAEQSGGRMNREMYNKAENDKIEWQSRAIFEGLSAAYGLTYQQVVKYLDGELAFSEVVRAAEPHVELAKATSDNVREVDRLLAKAYDQAAKQGPLHPGTREVARHKILQEDLKMPEKDIVAYLIRTSAKLDAIRVDHAVSERPSSARNKVR